MIILDRLKNQRKIRRIERNKVETSDIKIDAQIILDHESALKDKMKRLRKLAVANLEDVRWIGVIDSLIQSQKLESLNLTKHLDELILILENRSQLNEQIKRKHLKFSKLKEIQDTMKQLRDKKRKIINSSSNSPKRKSSNDHNFKQKEKIEQSLCEVRREIIQLTNLNENLYNDMESIEKMSFKLFYYFLSEGQTDKVKPIIEQSLLNDTVQILQKSTSFLLTESAYMSKIQSFENQFKTETDWSVIYNIWSKCQFSGNGVNLIDEFKVKI